MLRYCYNASTINFLKWRRSLNIEIWKLIRKVKSLLLLCQQWRFKMACILYLLWNELSWAVHYKLSRMNSFVNNFAYGTRHMEYKWQSLLKIFRYNGSSNSTIESIRITISIQYLNARWLICMVSKNSSRKRHWQ